MFTFKVYKLAMRRPEGGEKEIDMTDPNALEARAARSINKLSQGGLLARAHALAAAADLGLVQSLREQQAQENPGDLSLQEKAQEAAANTWTAADVCRALRRNPDYFKIKD
jgi:hypothetical protein